LPAGEERGEVGAVRESGSGRRKVGGGREERRTVGAAAAVLIFFFFLTRAEGEEGVARVEEL
jgi:hypothetical protein